MCSRAKLLGKAKYLSGLLSYEPSDNRKMAHSDGPAKSKIEGAKRGKKKQLLIFFSCIDQDVETKGEKFEKEQERAKA